MPRTIVYDPPAVQAHMTELAKTIPSKRIGISPRRTRALREEAEERAEVQPPGQDAILAAAAGSTDSYLAKIAKYVPAEVVTVTTLGFAAFSPHGKGVWWWVGLGALVNVVYLFGTAVVEKGVHRPRWFFYLLSAGAFFLWAMVVIDTVQKQAGLTGNNADTKQTFILAGAALLLPLLDNLLHWADDRLLAARGSDGPPPPPPPAPAAAPPDNPPG